VRVRRLRHLAVQGSDERGAVMVTFAVFAPVLVLFFSFVVDVGNSFVHARHLQVQADAGALAAAREFGACFGESKSGEEAADASIYARAAEYSGAAKVATPSGEVTALAPLYNEQIGGTAQKHIKDIINGKRYYGQSSPVDASAEEKAPCEAGMIDVKLTETELPWYIRVFKSIFNGVPYTNAHARVQILQVNRAKSVAPLAVAQTAPVAARAYFVNEDKGNEVIGSVPLIDTGTNPQGQAVWSNPTNPFPLEVKKTAGSVAHIGVKIALSGNPSDTKCGDALVQCFDEQTGPMLHIAGYSEEGTGSLKAPIAHNVTLSVPAAEGCSDAYFSTTAAECKFTITAHIDYGSTKTAGITVSPEVKGAKGHALTFNAATTSWSGNATLSPETGSNEVSLIVECNSKAKESACPAESTKATISDVNRSYSASFEKNSGTIESLSLAEIEGAVQDADSFEVCETKDANQCTHKLVVTMDVAGSLNDAKGFNDPLQHLRFEGEQGVRAGCPPPSPQSASEYEEHLREGCPGTYTINTKNPACALETFPYECLTIGLKGKDTGPTRHGIDARIESSPGAHFYTCNNWVNNNGGGVPIIPVDDSRIIQVFVIPYGTVDSEGRSTLGREEVPIQNFAAFYVMGFPGDKCKSDPSTGNAEIVGHFIKYVTPNNSGGETRCTASAFGECVAVLTR
jgi:hypothetical protein